MKIAVAAYQKSQTSEISVQAGRAPFYLLFDERGALLEILKNPFSIGGGGAAFGVRIPVKKATCSGNKKPLPELSVSPLLSYQGGFFASTKRHINSPPITSFTTSSAPLIL